MQNSFAKSLGDALSPQTGLLFPVVDVDLEGNIYKDTKMKLIQDAIYPKV